ncbi:MAG: hypothetical protein Q8Q51_11670 [Lutibacter sp.]|nr:hypothetical protein [Lutibacter sp.]
MKKIVPTILDKILYEKGPLLNNYKGTDEYFWANTQEVQVMHLFMTFSGILLTSIISTLIKNGK